MWRFLINMSIARRLTVAATITALIPGIVISILGSSYASTLNTVNNTVQVDDTAVKLVTDMQADLLRMNALLGTFSMAPSSAASNVQNSREIVQLAILAQPWLPISKTIRLPARLKCRVFGMP